MKSLIRAPLGAQEKYPFLQLSPNEFHYFKRWKSLEIQLSTGTGQEKT